MKGCGENWELNGEPLVCGEYIEDVGFCRICEAKEEGRREVIDYVKSCRGNYYGDKVFTPGDYHYFIVDKKDLEKKFAVSVNQEEVKNDK